MKLRPRDLPGAVRRGLTGLLIHGPDPVPIRALRDEALALLVGPGAEAEMRLTRIDAAALRSDAALLQDAQRAMGFFPGPRAVLVEDATDGLAEVFAEALEGAEPGRDAVILATGSELKKASRLRRAFETAEAAASVQLYADPPGREAVEAALAAEGLRPPGGEAGQALLALAAQMDLGALADFIRRLALYKLDDPAPLSVADIEACAPLAVEAEADSLLLAVADRRVAAVGPLLARLAGQGVAASTLCIAAVRHFRTLHAAVTDPAGAEAALNRGKPPIWGPRRDAILRQAPVWPVRRVEEVLRMLTETGLTLRSASSAPPFALLERTLLRIAMVPKDR